MAQQTNGRPAEGDAGLGADEALGQVLRALADAGRHGRDGSRIIAIRVGHRVGVTGDRVVHRTADATTDAARRLGSAYLALRGPEPYLWRTRHVAVLVLAGVVAGAWLSHAYARRVRVLQEIASEAVE